MAEPRSESGFFSRVYAVVRGIPQGRVATYGQVARLLGVPRGARAVGWALRALTGAREHRVPWHRVVGAGGRISQRAGRGAAEQIARLKAEGVGFRKGCVDLDGYGLGLPGPTRGNPKRSRAVSTASRRRASSRAAGSTRP